MNEQRIEKIKALIASTTILTPQEKSEWSSLLPLMNDKQFSELEDILLPHVETSRATPPVTPSSTPKPVPPRPAVSPRSPVIPPGNPPLSHIQNLPSQFTTPTQNRAVPMSPRSVPVAPRPPQPAAPVHRPAPPVRPAQPIVKPSMPVARPVERLATHAKPSVHDPVPKPPAPKPATFNSLESLSVVTVHSIRDIDHAAVLAGLRKLAAQFGYFTVLQAFEASPLYKDYLHYGKQKLMAGAAETKLPMLQEEFEFITDILLSLKVNRV